MRWFDSRFCRPGGSHCRRCRDAGEIGAWWRTEKRRHFDLPDGDWDCPHGLPWGWRPQPGLGDAVEWALDKTGVGPVYKAVHRRLTGRPCGCARRKATLNRWGRQVRRWLRRVRLWLG